MRKISRVALSFVVFIFGMKNVLSAEMEFIGVLADAIGITQCDTAETNNDCEACALKGCYYCVGDILDTKKKSNVPMGRHCVKHIEGRNCQGPTNWISSEYGNADKCAGDPCMEQSTCGDCVSEQCMFCPFSMFSSRSEDAMGGKCISVAERENVKCGYINNQNKEFRTMNFVEQPDNVEGGQDVDLTEGISTEKVLAVSVRVLKTAFVVGMAVMAITGASLITGPAAPFIFAAASICFFAYTLWEKKRQADLKEVFNLLQFVLTEVGKIMGPCMLDSWRHSLMNLERTMAMLTLHLPAMRANLREMDELFDKKGLLTNEDANAKMLRKGKSAEVENKLAQVEDGVRIKLQQMCAAFESQIDIAKKLGELQAPIFERMREIGPKIFGENFERILKAWDVTLAAGSVAIAGGVLSGAEHLVHEAVEEGGLTAAHVAAEGVTTGFHAYEMKDLTSDSKSLISDAMGWLEDELEGVAKEPLSPFLSGVANHQAVWREACPTIDWDSVPSLGLGPGDAEAHNTV